MIGGLISLLSLNLTLSLVQASQVAGSFTITNATATTPIAITCPAHGVPPGRVVHAVVSGVGGELEANGLWQLNPTDANTFTLSTFTAQGIPVQSVGVNAYTSGGVAQYAFPDFRILLGRRNVQFASAVASPRVVFVPTDGRAWSFEPYGGAGNAPAQSRGTVEQQAQTQQPQLATSFPTFEVYVTGSANPPSPDFGDFDATQAIVDALYAVVYNAVGGLPRGKILRDGWPSQVAAAGSATQRGQQWMGILELQHPVTVAPLSFVPSGVSLVMTVVPEDGGSGDQTIITIPSS